MMLTTDVTVLSTDLMYVSGQQTVTGRHHYHQAGVSGDLLLLGTLNGLDLTSVLRLGQTLTVPVASLTQAEVDVLLVTNNINGVRIAEWSLCVVASRFVCRGRYWMKYGPFCFSFIAVF